MKKITLTANSNSAKNDTISFFKTHKLLLALLMVFMFCGEAVYSQVYTIDATHGGSGTNLVSKGKEAGLCAFAVGKNKNRVQYMIQDYELDNFLPESGTISHIGFNVLNLNNGTKPLKGVTLKVWEITNGQRNNFKNPSLHSMSTSGFSEKVNLYLGDLAITSTGWYDIDLGAAAFYYNTDPNKHLVIEISNDNSGTGDRANENFTIATHKTGSVYTMRARYSTDDSNLSFPSEDADELPNTASAANNTSEYTQRANRADMRFTYRCTDKGSGGMAVVDNAGTGCLGAPVKLKVNGGSDASGLGYQWQRSLTGLAAASAWTNIPGATSATYSTTTAMTVVYYRRNTYCTVNPSDIVNSQKVAVAAAVFKEYHNGNWFMNSNPTTAPTASSSESILIAEGTYEVNSNVSACSCMANANANLIVASGKTLTLTGPVVDGGGTIIFESGSALLQPNGIVNTGEVIYKRDSQPMVKFDFTYWSSPVFSGANDSNPFTLGQFSPNTLSDRFYSWDNAAQNWHQEGPSTIVEAGKGYIIRSPQTFSTNPNAAAAFNGQFAGVPFNGDTTAEVASHGLYSLIGNPFPSAIDANAVINDVWNSDRFQGTFYFWTHTSPVASGYSNPSDSNTYSYNNDDYALYNLMGGTEGPSARYIGAGQSFMVVGKNSGGTLKLTNAMRVGGSNNNSFYRSSTGRSNETSTTSEDEEKHRVWLQLANSVNYKQTLVGYASAASNGMDYGYDGTAMTGTGLGFYSLVDGVELGIQGRALPFNADDQVPLGFTTANAGTHTLSMYNNDGVFATEGVNVFLEDTMLGVIHNLKEGAYTFSTAAGTFNSRFILRYAATSLATGEVTHEIDGVVVYKQQSSLHVNSADAFLKSVKVFDLAGRLLASKSDINGSEITFDNMNWSSQVIIVQALTDNNTTVTKKVVF
ncbi:MAG TPA: T9SS sorting signal type C domain-containing protein [Flavobacterium sp.]|jgi:hypothetical protein